MKASMKEYLINVGGETIGCKPMKSDLANEWTMSYVAPETHTGKMEYYMNRKGRVYFRTGKNKMRVEGIIDFIKANYKYGDMIEMTMSTV